MRLKFVLAALFLTASLPAFSQVAPTATQEGANRLAVGGGFSFVDPDWGVGEMYAPTVWLDYRISRVPRLLQGLGAELEGRDVNYHRGNQQYALRQDTFGGGATYTWYHFHRIHPYGKFLLSYGSIDFHGPNPNYRHDTRTVYTAGGGVDYHLIGSFSVRADYEYQFWPQLFQGHQTLDPIAGTIGLSYRFGPRH